MARSFLQAVATEEVAPPLRVVQMEGLVTNLGFLFRAFLFFFFLGGEISPVCLLSSFWHNFREKEGFFFIPIKNLTLGTGRTLKLRIIALLSIMN